MAILTKKKFAKLTYYLVSLKSICRCKFTKFYLSATDSIINGAQRAQHATLTQQYFVLNPEGLGRLLRAVTTALLTVAGRITKFRIIKYLYTLLKYIFVHHITQLKW